MTPNEHLTKAESLLELCDQWGHSSRSSAGAALQATAHVQLALAKVERCSITLGGFSKDDWDRAE